MQRIDDKRMSRNSSTDTVAWHEQRQLGSWAAPPPSHAAEVGAQLRRSFRAMLAADNTPGVPAALAWNAVRLPVDRPPPLPMLRSTRTTQSPRSSVE